METLNVNAREAEKGFTLVELAIVMVIIGVLIGGVLKGQEMITNARVTATASEMESIQAAYNSFVDRFNVQPGDMPTPQNRIANCPAASACRAAGTAATLGNGEISLNVGAVPGGEGIAFYGQLLGAGYISGMTGASATVAVGVTNPAGPLPQTVFKVGDARVGATAFTAGELYQRPYVVLDGGVAVTSATTGTLDPLQAATIDRRLDDGVGDSGVLVAVGTNCETAGVYAEATLTGNCALAYRL